MKTCLKCGETKPLDAFPKSRDSRDGRYTYCKSCKAGWLRQHRRENPEYWRKYNREYKAKNREKMREQARARYAADPARHVEMSRRSAVKKRYGLTLEEYEAIIACGCAICGSDGPRMALDHDHTNGRIRDALCANCNNGLGRFHDDPVRLRAAADYIEKHCKE